MNGHKKETLSVKYIFCRNSKSSKLPISSSCVMCQKWHILIIYKNSFLCRLFEFYYLISVQYHRSTHDAVLDRMCVNILHELLDRMCVNILHEKHREEQKSLRNIETLNNEVSKADDLMDWQMI